MLRWKRTRKELVKTSFRGDDAATVDADEAAYVTNIPDVYKSPKRQNQVNCIAHSRNLVRNALSHFSKNVSFLLILYCNAV